MKWANYQLIEEEINNPDSTLIIKDIEILVKLAQKETPGPDGFTGGSYANISEEIIANSSRKQKRQNISEPILQSQHNADTKIRLRHHKRRKL